MQSFLEEAPDFRVVFPYGQLVHFTFPPLLNSPTGHLLHFGSLQMHWVLRLQGIFEVTSVLKAYFPQKSFDWPGLQ
jgi:hypothetical protein